MSDVKANAENGVALLRQTPPRRRHRDIDGGWAWVVMVASYMGMFIYCNAMYMGGVIYKELLHKFGEGEAKTALVGALNTGCLCFGAPLASVVINTFSNRVAIVTGGILSTLGLALSAFVPSLDWMIFTAGIVVGIGYSLASAGVICVIGFYFEKRRDTIVSLAFFVVGFAMFFSAPLALILIENYALSGTFLILAGINAHMCVIGVIAKPSVLENGVQKDKTTKRRDSIRTLSRRDSLKERSKTYLDLSLLKNIPFMCFLLSTCSWNFGLNVGIMHLPNYIATIGGSASDIGYIMTSFSVGNILGRLCGSLSVNRFGDRCLFVQAVILLISGLVTSSFPLYSQFPSSEYVFSMQLGVFCGWPNSMMTPLSLSFVGLKKLSEAYGLAYLFCGFGVTTGPVAVGALYINSGSYVYSFVVAGIVLLFGGMFALLAHCMRVRTTDGPNQNMEVVVNDGEAEKMNNISAS